MENYQIVKQWAATVNLDAAVSELVKIKTRYPWLKCHEIDKTLMQLSSDLPKIVSIITHQEKQNAIHREFIRVSGAADAAIITAIQELYKL